MRSIIVSSLKGGSGKSTYSILLAKALSKMGYNVAFFDADISSSSFSEFSGQKFNQNSVQINSITKKMLPFFWVHDSSSNAIEVIATSMVAGNENAVVGEDMKQFICDVLDYTEWGEKIDFLIVDAPAGLGNIYLSLVENLIQKKNHLGDIIISVPSQRDALKKVVKFTKSKSKVLGIVTNFSTFECPNCKNNYHIFGKEIAEQVARDFDVKFFGSIPFSLDFSHRENGGAILPAEIPKEFDNILKKTIFEIENANTIDYKKISTGKVKKFIQEQIATILFDLIVMANDDIQIGKYYNQFPFENSVRIAILNEDFKIMNSVILKLEDIGLKILKNKDEKADYEIYLTFRTLARIIMQKFRDDSDKQLYDYTVIDAWRNRDIMIKGAGSTQRMIEFFNVFLREENIVKLMKDKAKIIQGWI